MALTRGETDFIQFIRDHAKDEKIDSQFIDELAQKIQRGERPEQDGDRILWGKPTFTEQFINGSPKLENISTEMLFAICNLLLTKKTFGDAPLRQPHLFSFACAELLNRLVTNLNLDNPQLSEEWRELNRNMLQQSIYLNDASIKRGGDATTNSVSNFIFMRSVSPDAMPKLKEAMEKLQSLFSDDLQKQIAEIQAEALAEKVAKKFVTRPNSPIPQRKPVLRESKKQLDETKTEAQAEIKPEVKVETKKEAAPQSPHLSALRKQYEDLKKAKPHRSASTGVLFGEKPRAAPAKSKSDSSAQNEPRKPTKGSSGNG